MNQKAGILTHFYHNRNYGGVLQAYALCKVIRDLNPTLECEQIQYCHTSSFQNTWRSFCMARFPEKWKKVKKFGKDCAFSVHIRLYDGRVREKLAVRAEAFDDFCNTVVPHSEKTYNDDNITEASGNYDLFLTGSDQVWNPLLYSPTYRLDFVPAGKRKISYAASMAVEALTREQKEVFEKSLSDYSAVSVREDAAVTLLKDLSPVPVELVLDPTLLLSRAEWDEICADNPVKGKYIFCYFLGDNKKSRRIALQYSKKHNLPIVTLPYLNHHYRACDDQFGDQQLYDVSPGQFITLIKNAECVFTDSFHAMVFSAVYQKPYAIFDRSEKQEMTSRIDSLSALLGTENRFCHTDAQINLAYIEKLPPVNALEISAGFMALKEKSLQYLQRNLLSQENAKGEEDSK